MPCRTRHPRSHRRDDRQGLLVAHRRHRPPRVQGRLPTALGIPDVPDARHVALIEQGLADPAGGVVGAQPGQEALGVKGIGEDVGAQGGQSLVAFLLFINDVQGMGLKVAQGLQLLEAFYWDQDDDTRAFAKRFAARPGMNGKMPSGNQAGVYASTLAYLNAVAATGSDNARDVVPEMKKFKGKDKLFGDVTIRQDGRVIHPMYLFEVKKPEESKYPYDYYRLISTIPADQAFRPIADGGCSLVK